MARMNDRGQILLIGALTIAITFVALGIVLNGSLHTPSMAAQAAEDVTDNDLQRIHDTIERETAAAMERAPTGDQTYVEKRIERLGVQLREYYARTDVVIDFGSVNPVAGTLADTTVDPGDTESYGGAGGTEFSQFQMTPSVSGTEAVEIELSDTGGGGPAYSIDITDGTLEVNGETCSYATDIHIAQSRTDQGVCSALEFVDSLDDSYTIEIRSTNGGSADFELFYRDSGGNRVYETEVPYTVTTTEMTFDGVIEVEAEP